MCVAAWAAAADLLRKCKLDLLGVLVRCRRQLRPIWEVSLFQVDAARRHQAAMVACKLIRQDNRNIFSLQPITRLSRSESVNAVHQAGRY